LSAPSQTKETEHLRMTTSLAAESGQGLHWQPVRAAALISVRMAPRPASRRDPALHVSSATLQARKVDSAGRSGSSQCTEDVVVQHHRGVPPRFSVGSLPVVSSFCERGHRHASVFRGIDCGGPLKALYPVFFAFNSDFFSCAWSCRNARFD